MIRLTLALPLLMSIATGCGDTPFMPPVTNGTAIEGIPAGETIRSTLLSAPVDVVRDEWGIPHIYGTRFSDVAFVQGYIMAQDRLVAMDLGRRLAEGTVAELIGDQSPTAVDQDISMRMHHMRTTAEAIWSELKSSPEPRDRQIAQVVSRYVAGVNAYIDDLRAGKYTLPTQLLFVYSDKSAQPWDEADVMALGLLQAFYLSFDADSEIRRSEIDVAAAAQFYGSTDPDRKARARLAEDLQILEPVDNTFTLRGWPGRGGNPITAAAAPLPGGSELLALLREGRRTVTDMGNDHVLHESRGSNNWVVGPNLSKSGHPLVANDTHLSLGNPATFYLNHLHVDPSASPTPLPSDEPTVNVMGVQFPGIPGVILGMNRRIAWGATVNNIDVTDVYKESIVACDGGSDPCVMWKGNKVALTPRKETFKVGSFGKVSKTYELTLYDVPHHGPIVPRITKDHGVEPLAATELSVRYTGYEPSQIFRAVYSLDTASSVREAMTGLERDFRCGGQNWVIADTQGHIGWTETVRVPRRQKGFAPWKVMPGDGSAEWGPDMDGRFIPQAYDPMQGYIATANNDPIGVTEDNDPFFNEPEEPMGPGGSGSGPLYLGADYDSGTRVGRITKRIAEGTQGGKKLKLDDMSAIQGDAITEWGQLFQPSLLAAAQAITEESKSPGSHPEIAAIVAAADAADRNNAALVQGVIAAWSFDTPAGTVEDSDVPAAAQVRDAQATLVYNVWLSRLAVLSLSDELKVLNVRIGSTAQRKLLARMLTQPAKLATGISPISKDALLFDDLATPGVIESAKLVTARALLDALAYLRGRLSADFVKWRWGQVHTLTLEFPGGISALNVPSPEDTHNKDGFPRHGDDGTVDVAGHGLSATNYTYADGAAIRFVAEVFPDGPRAKNVLPGGQIFDPASPHYADQMELWRRNRVFDLAFTDEEVVASAMKEYSTNQIGRTRFSP